MKKITIILILLCNNLYSQIEVKLDNNLTGIYSSSLQKSFGCNFTGNNSIEFKKTSIDLFTNYSIRFSPTVKENEFTQKQNIGYESKKWNMFITHQFNYSLIRKISSDNWLGIGGGIKSEPKWGKLSLSYAVIYQSSKYFDNTDNYFFRHSIRLKLKFEKSNISIQSEYFYQPNIIDINDYIVYGNTKLAIFNNKPVSFIIQDFLNFRINSDIKMIHNLSLGIGVKFNKKYLKDK